MYRRLKNRMDLEMIKEKILRDEVNKTVLERVGEILDTLDSAYGEIRSSSAMGGYVFLFESETDYQKSVDKLLTFHHLKKEEYEYSECIEKGWQEDLYMLSSDDAMVLVYPKGEEQNGILYNRQKKI